MTSHLRAKRAPSNSLFSRSIVDKSLPQACSWPRVVHIVFYVYKFMFDSAKSPKMENSANGTIAKQLWRNILILVKYDSPWENGALFGDTAELPVRHATYDAHPMPWTLHC
jgi:hypothetical protein